MDTDLTSFTEKYSNEVDRCLIALDDKCTNSDILVINHLTSFARWQSVMPNGAYTFVNIFIKQYIHNLDCVYGFQISASTDA